MTIEITIIMVIVLTILILVMTLPFGHKKKNNGYSTNKNIVPYIPNDITEEDLILFSKKLMSDMCNSPLRYSEVNSKRLAWFNTVTGRLGFYGANDLDDLLNWAPFRK